MPTVRLRATPGPLRVRVEFGRDGWDGLLDRRHFRGLASSPAPFATSTTLPDLPDALVRCVDDALGNYGQESDRERYEFVYDFSPVLAKGPTVLDRLAAAHPDWDDVIRGRQPMSSLATVGFSAITVQDEERLRLSVQTVAVRRLALVVCDFIDELSAADAYLATDALDWLATSIVSARERVAVWEGRAPEPVTIEDLDDIEILESEDESPRSETGATP